MATMPNNFPTGHLVLASEWNAHATQINDNTSAIATNTSSISSQGSRITTLETKPKVILKKTANQSIPSGGTDTIVTWQTATGTTSMRSGDTVVIPSAGTYLLTANINMIGGGTTVADTVVYIVLNSTTNVFTGSLAAFAQAGNLSTSGVGNGLSTSVVASLAANDVIRVLTWQGSGAARDLRYQDFGGCTFTASLL